jgi:SAM-dependent methyltransferase
VAEERIKYQACPLCGSKDFSHLLTANWSQHPMFAHAGKQLSPEIRWCSCRSCGHVFTEGYFTPEAFAVLTQSANPGQLIGQDFERQRMVSARMIEKVLPFVSEGLWLDIGFGNGSLLMTAREYGFQVVGNDLREATVDAIAAFGVQAYCEDITRLKLPMPCSVLSMADVLEHMPFPMEGLRAAHGLLRQGGVLFISMPNADSPLWALLNQANANPYWGEVEHYHNFGRERLYKLLAEAGFKPLRYGISERYRACMEVIAQKL